MCGKNHPLTRKKVRQSDGEVNNLDIQIEPQGVPNNLHTTPLTCLYAADLRRHTEVATLLLYMCDKLQLMLSDSYHTFSPSHKVLALVASDPHNTYSIGS